MKCPYCAEAIKDEAVVCRYCGATGGEAGWTRAATAPASTRRAPAGTFTLRTSGFLFVASAAIEGLSLGSEVPLAGALRGGLVAALYHLFYIALFLALGVGLWRLTRCGYYLVFAATAVYTVDRLLVVLDSETLEAYFRQAFAGHPEVSDLVDLDAVAQLASMATLAIVVCWWLFALYVFSRRNLFAPATSAPEQSAR